nr:MAG TPA: hypothetical protein [Caudoviricetes sp.]
MSKLLVHFKIELESLIYQIKNQKYELNRI